MHRSLLYSLLGASLLTSGCSTIDDWGGVIPSAVGSAPFVYHPPVQQGNVVTQQMVNQLRPGMDKSQVRYILGTPTLMDAFHQDRWDYYYSKVEDGELEETYRFTVFFEDGRLNAYSGDFKPDTTAAPGVKEQVFVVPEKED